MRSYVYVNGEVKTFDCSYKDLPEKYKSFPVLQYKTNQMSCTGYTALFNSDWQVEKSYNEKVKLIDPDKEVRELGLYLPDYVKYIFEIIEFPNWEIAGKFTELEKKLKEKDNQIDFLKRENERLEEEIKELKRKINKRNRLIKKLRGNCQAIIIQLVIAFFACQDSSSIFGLDSKHFSPLANQGQWAFFVAKILTLKEDNNAD